MKSNVLHFLSNRNVVDFDSLDTESARKCRSLTLLTGRAVRWLWSWSVLYHLLQTMLTLVVIWSMIDSGRDNNPYPSLFEFSRLYVETMPDFIRGYENNTSESLLQNCTDLTLGSDSCYLEILKDWLNHDPQGMDEICNNPWRSGSINITNEELQIATGAILFEEDTTISTVLENVIFFNWIGVLCLILADGNLVLDIVYRAPYVLRQGSAKAAWLYRMPWSYTERQLSIFMYTLFNGFVVYSFYYAQQINGLIGYMKGHLPTVMSVVSTEFAEIIRLVHETQSESRNSTMDDEFAEKYIMEANWVAEHLNVIEETKSAVQIYIDRSSYLLILCLVLRCVITVYSMRLIPGIGLFVITTKRMIQHLAEFYCVFFVIQLAVASTFHYLMRSRPCLPQVMEGYETFPDALYSTFMLAANPGTFQLARENVSTRVLLVVFLIMMAIFLLNLITAVMTASVMALAQPGRRRFLCEQERWKELIGVQAMSRILPKAKQ